MLIHRYWTGPNPPSFSHLTDSDLPPELTEWLDARMPLAPIKPFHHRANMVRWWLLYEHGGVWLDCDIPTPDTFPSLPFALHSPDPNRFRVGVMGFPPHHPIPSLALTHLNDTTEQGTSVDVSGSTLLRRLITQTSTTLQRFVL